MFSLFPLLILLSLLVGSLHLNTISVFDTLSRVLPADMLDLLKSYLTYVSDSFDVKLLMFAIVFSIYFPWRFIRGLMESVSLSYNRKDPSGLVIRILKQLLCTILLPVTLILSLILIVLGQNVITFFVRLLPPGTLQLSQVILHLWQYGRFLIAAGLMTFALIILYRLAIPDKIPLRTLLPGTAFSILAWVISSGLFSFYVENFGSYSVIYGTLGAFIVLLLWLYLTSMIFILGSEINAMWWGRKQVRQEADKTAAAEKKEPSAEPEPARS